MFRSAYNLPIMLKGEWVMGLQSMPTALGGISSLVGLIVQLFPYLLKRPTTRGEISNGNGLFWPTR